MSESPVASAPTEVARKCAVVDANIVASLMAASISPKVECSGDPAAAFEKIRREQIEVHLDTGGHVEQEWQASTDPDWYSNWYLEFASSNVVVSREVAGFRTQMKHLHVTLGFPTSRDTWVARTALSVASDGQVRCQLLTEDVDFFDPKQKKAPRNRLKLLEGRSKGPVQRYLQKTCGVDVSSLFLFVDD